MSSPPPNRQQAGSAPKAKVTGGGVSDNPESAVPNRPVPSAGRAARGEESAVPEQRRRQQRDDHSDGEHLYERDRQAIQGVRVHDQELRGIGLNPLDLGR